MYRVAVVGAGPSGLYAAAALLTSDVPVSVEVLDRLPAPYGLVRYGVAPDHVKMKSVIRVLQRPFDPAELEFLGGVHVGEDGLPLDVLREHVHAVIHATGSSVDRALGVPGEDLVGSLGSGALVSWYSGHPDFADLAPPLDRPGVAVVGAGTSRSTWRGCWPAAPTRWPSPTCPSRCSRRWGTARCATSTSSCVAAPST